MFCQFCGTAIIAGGSVCPKCGATATGQPAPVAGPPNAFAPPAGGNWAASPVPPRQGSSFPWIIIAAVGCLGLIVVVGVIAAIMVPALSAARTASRSVDCKNSLKQIGIYTALYETKFRAWPPTLRVLWRPDLATDANIFICPVTGNRYKPSAAPGLKWEEFASRVSFDYGGPDSWTGSGADAGMPTSTDMMAWDHSPHPDGRRCILYGSGRVDTMDEAAFQSKLKAQR